jgi:hypothetical protein
MLFRALCLTWCCGGRVVGAHCWGFTLDHNRRRIVDRSGGGDGCCSFEMNRQPMTVPSLTICDHQSCTADASPCCIRNEVIVMTMPELALDWIGLQDQTTPPVHSACMYKSACGCSFTSNVAAKVGSAKLRAHHHNGTSIGQSLAVFAQTAPKLISCSWCPCFAKLIMPVAPTKCQRQP